MNALLSTGRFVIIHFLMLLAPALADIIFLGFMAFTVTCFAVAGVFSAVFCFGTVDENRRDVLFTLIAVLSVCVLLFFLFAPLSGPEYNLPVKSFAVTEALTAVFLWRIKFS